MQSQQQGISVIIPFLNEEENIARLVYELSQYLTEESFKSGTSFEVVFVNDGSTDKSLAMLQSAAHRGYTPTIVSLSRNYGSHAALRAGIQTAKYGSCVFMYADLQDPLDLIPTMHKLMHTDGLDIVWAQRRSTELSLGTKLFSEFYAAMMKKYAMSNFPDKGFDIVMFNHKVKDALNQNIEANSSVFLQILNFGFKQDAIDYDKLKRLGGKSKWTLAKKVKLFIDSFVAFSFAPIRFVTLVGFVIFFLGLVYASYVIGRKLIYNDISAGWPATVVILALGFGITNISLGIIAEYLWRTLDASRKRPVFIIDTIWRPEATVEHVVEPADQQHQPLI